jgi:hypothetical protein
VLSLRLLFGVVARFNFYKVPPPIKVHTKTSRDPPKAPHAFQTFDRSFLERIYPLADILSLIRMSLSGTLEVAKWELHRLEGEVQKGIGGDKERLEERFQGCLGAWSGYGQGSGERYSQETTEGGVSASFF